MRQRHCREYPCAGIHSPALRCGRSGEGILRDRAATVAAGTGAATPHAFKLWLKSQQAWRGGPVLPKSPMRQAIACALNQWEALCVYTTDAGGATWPSTTTPTKKPCGGCAGKKKLDLLRLRQRWPHRRRPVHLPYAAIPIKVNAAFTAGYFFFSNSIARRSASFWSPPS